MRRWRSRRESCQGTRRRLRPAPPRSRPRKALDGGGPRSKTPFPFKASARFADNLYRARELAELDQKEAAKRAALTRSKLDKIESGYIPTLNVLIRLAGTYSTSVGDLVNGVTWRPSRVEHSGPAEYLVQTRSVSNRTVPVC